MDDNNPEESHHNPCAEYCISKATETISQLLLQEGVWSRQKLRITKKPTGTEQCLSHTAAGTILNMHGKYNSQKGAHYLFRGKRYEFSGIFR